MVIEECNDCGKKISEEEFYCEECRKRAMKKIERNNKASEKRKDERAIRDYDEWAKSGYRTH